MDFSGVTTYSFVIQKKINYEEFCSLMKHLGIDAIIIESEDNRALIASRVGFGKYKGLLYSELPDHYLEWLKRNYRGEEKAFIDAEIKRRAL